MKLLQSKFSDICFHGHKLPEMNGEGIRVGKSKEDHFHITVAAYVQAEEGIVQRVPNSKGRQRSLSFLDIEISDDISFYDKYLVSEQKEQTRRLVNLDKSLNELMRRSSRFQGHSHYPIQVVFAQSTDSNDLGSLWDKIGLTSLRPEVIAGLQLIEPKIKDAFFC